VRRAKWHANTKGERTVQRPNGTMLPVVVQVKQSDELEEILTRKFTSFLEQRAEAFRILRRKPVEVRSSPTPPASQLYPSRPSGMILSFTFSW
jgi:hypothetical protein